MISNDSPLFLVKICLLIITTFTPKEPIILLQYQGLFILADNVLLNIMACRVYHSLTVAILQRNSDTSTEQSTMNFRRESWATADAKNVIPSSVFAMRVRSLVPGMCLCSIGSDVLALAGYKSSHSVFRSGRRVCLIPWAGNASCIYFLGLFRGSGDWEPEMSKFDFRVMPREEPRTREWYNNIPICIKISNVLPFSTM